MQGVDSHVPGEEHVEAAKPEQLAAMAGHGSLGEAERPRHGTHALSQAFFPHLEFLLPRAHLTL